jgi:hypothetical protein
VMDFYAIPKTSLDHLDRNSDSARDS